MNNKNANIITAKEMIDHISKKENLKQLLIKYEIANLSDIYNTEYYQVDERRCGVIVDSQESNFKSKTKIMIDLRHGEPTVNQVSDALYDVGKDCAIKIIFYVTGDTNYDESVVTADGTLVANLIAKLQDRNVPILLLSFDINNFEEVYSDQHQNWNKVNRLKASKIPSKEGFVAETFWNVYFENSCLGLYYPFDVYSGEFINPKENQYCIYIDRAFFGEIKALWNGEEIVLEIKQLNESDEYLKKVLDLISQRLIYKYGKSSFKFQNVVGKLPVLYIKYTDKPIEWFYTAAPEEIAAFAEKMTKEVMELCCVIDEARKNYVKYQLLSKVSWSL